MYNAYRTNGNSVHSAVTITSVPRKMRLLSRVNDCTSVPEKTPRSSIAGSVPAPKASITSAACSGLPLTTASARAL